MRLRLAAWKLAASGGAEPKRFQTGVIMTRTRIVALAASLVAALAAAGLALGSAGNVASAATSSGSVTVRHCQVLRTLPAYVYRYQGATVNEPTGAARYREVVLDGLTGANLQRVCKAQVDQQVASRGAPAPVLGVLRELHYG